MNLFSSIESEKSAKELFDIASHGTKVLEQKFRKLSKKGIYEALLFNTNLVLYTIRSVSSNQRKDYILILYFLIKEEKPNMPQNELIDFINNRLCFYMEDFNKLINDKFYTGMFCYSNFYINPLHEESPLGSTDTLELISFKSALFDMIIWVQEQIQ